MVIFYVYSWNHKYSKYIVYTQYTYTNSLLNYNFLISQGFSKIIVKHDFMA